MKKPEPKPTAVMCSVCGLDWQKHGDKPTLEKCIELLKAELASARPRQWSYNNFADNTAGGGTFTVIPPGPTF